MPEIYLRTADINKALKDRFGPPESAIIFNVANGTGAGVSRWADALAMGIWPSRGLNLIGFEVKAARGDWLKELKDPAKAETSIFRFCDNWNVVAPEGVVKVEEVPEPWGLLVVKASRDGKLSLHALKPAPKLEPVPITRMVLAAIFRRVDEQNVDVNAVRDASLAARKNGLEEGIKAGQRDSKNVRTELEELRQRVADFEGASGVHIDRWEDGKKIGGAVRMILQGFYPLEELQRMHDSIGRIIQESTLAKVNGQLDAPPLPG